MEDFFEIPTNQKGKSRQGGFEKVMNDAGEEVPGSWTKYKHGQFYVTPDIMYVFQAAKWGTSLFGETPLKDLFSDDITGQADKGQLQYGQGREAFEMIDEC